MPRTRTSRRRSPSWSGTGSAGALRQDLDPYAAAWWLMSLLHARTFRAALMPEQAGLEGQLADMTLDTVTSP
ncbi:hypothetical protein [Streptomyces phaeochromogenes]